MGFTSPPAPTPMVLAVATVTGRAVIRGRQHPKCRVWVLEDRTAVVCLPSGGGKVAREVYPIAASLWDEKAKLLTVTVEASGEVLTVDAKGCGCGMGVVGSAGPVEGRFDTTRVRAPEWHEVMR